jgi:hypothetical protein
MAGDLQLAAALARVDAYAFVLHSMLNEPHRCRKDELTDTQGRLRCSCGKEERDAVIREVLKLATPNRFEELRAALDYIDGHGCDDDSRTAQAALEGRWKPPGCCPGH